MVILLYVFVATGYSALALWGWRAALPRATPVLALSGSAAFAENDSAAEFGPSERGLLLLVWALHFFLLGRDLFGGEGMRFGFALGLSATIWLAVAVFWIESLFFSLASMRLLILPVAALCALLPAWFPGSASLAVPGAMHRPTFEMHLVVALAAYGLLTIAALHALLMAALERWLHLLETSSETSRHPVTRMKAALLGQLPPLMTMERLLFRMVGAGFALLTLTVLTGIVFSEALFGQPLRFDHKTVFTLLAWIIFASLLVGRVVYGWRGRIALRWTLAGFVALLLGYVGSRFVLEVILHRF